MAEFAAAMTSPATWRNQWLWIWLAAFALVSALYIWPHLAPWAVDYPEDAIVPVSSWISTAMAVIKDNLSWATRGMSKALGVPLSFLSELLSKGFKIGYGLEATRLPPISWLGVCIAFVLAGYRAGGWRLATLAGACFLFLAVFGKWQASMLTLALIAVAVPLCVSAGLLIGIWGYNKAWAGRFVVSPALDLMQTMPTFAYLIPMLLLFGNSPVSAMLATAIFATPPMVRATILGLQRVPAEISDFGEMAGCTARQKLWRVLIPAARPMLMVGVNQVIMLALNMVIISSMIGAGGLGYDVLLALRALKIGQGMEAGLAIVAIAIALDRLSHALAHAKPVPHSENAPVADHFWQRYPFATAALAAIIVTTLAGLVVPGIAVFPKAYVLSSAGMWKEGVKWININYFDYIEAFRVTMIIYVLKPLRLFLEGFPWAGAVLLIALAGYRLGGVSMALLTGVLTAFCAATGLWEKTMATVYLCGISALIATMLGVPLGLLAARKDRFNRMITPVIDTLQTLPSFCFIIPVVMLFRIGDVTAIIATVAFAIVPAIRYTNHGIRQVPLPMIEAAKVAGCTRRQTFWRVELPLALPEIMLGINQTILMALAMIVICAMIGTRDLGQEVFIALSKADAGRGIVAGLAIAFIGIVADRLIGRLSDKTRKKLG